MIESCHVFVGILGASWGSAFPGDAKRSIVEWEIDTARQREDLEIMTFLKKLPPGTEVDPRQKELLEEVTGFEHGLWCKFFDSTESLVQLVRSSLEGWLVEFWARMQRARLGAAVRLHRILSALAAAAAFALLFVVFTQRSQITRTALIGASACVAILILVCIVLFLAETGGSHDHAG
jgi:hypothetical protein